MVSVRGEGGCVCTHSVRPAQLLCVQGDSFHVTPQ